MKRSAPLQRKTPMKRSAKPLARSKLNPVSKDPKKRAVNSAYDKAVREWWKDHDHRCEMMFTFDRVNMRVTPVRGPRCGNLIGLPSVPMERCPKPASKRPHHMKRRGKFKCDKSTFLGLCNHCHIHWLHNNEEAARRLGYLLDRPAKTSPK